MTRLIMPPTKFALIMKGTKRTGRVVASLVAIIVSGDGLNDAIDAALNARVDELSLASLRNLKFCSSLQSAEVGAVLRDALWGLDVGGAAFLWHYVDNPLQALITIFSMREVWNHGKRLHRWIAALIHRWRSRRPTG